VLDELVGNALKFTAPGGQVDVHASRDGAWVRCDVFDTGVGIAGSDVPKLFQRFSQLPEGLNRGGTGLGLALCKTIVEAHGGKIGVESTPGAGSRFWFTLPAEGPPAA
jgi:signal transduction histidine kinase